MNREDYKENHKEDHKMFHRRSMLNKEFDVLTKKIENLMHFN
jgi:hypothetical protein